jgi:hypothetical protein
VATYTENTQDSARVNQMLWFAGALGTAVGVAVWAYNRREPTYWERTKQVAGQVADTASDINPWVGAGAGAAALGCAALAYSRRRPKSAWDRAAEQADEALSQARKQLRPWLGVLASTAISVASAAYKSKSRQRAQEVVSKETGNAAERIAETGSQILKRLRTISGETSKLYPRVKQMIG